MLRLAMWSGPRNISTAMMRSWGNRSDTFVCDEPLYAHYLHATGKHHPGADKIIAAGETDWPTVVRALTEEEFPGKKVYFQKQMTHHLLPHVDRAWLSRVTNCFLIRDPREVLTSYVKIVQSPTLEDTGFPQLTEIFEWVRCHQGVTPPVLDAAEVLKDPRRMLGLLCDALGVPFEEAMLAWPAGPRPTDGVWARHWYSAVDKSTGFQPFQPKNEPIPAGLQSLHQVCEAHYARLHALRLQ